MAQTFSDIVSGDSLTLVDFFAEWCGPCKTMAPILKEVKTKVGENARIIKIDIDKQPALSNFYQVQGVPTLILFKKGKIVWRQSGVVPAHEIQKVVERFG